MIEKIIKAIDLSCLAYQEPADIESAIKGKYDNFKWVEETDTDTQCFICEDYENAWLTFRGTEFDGPDKFRDLETDLDCKLVKGPYGLVHRGFYDAVQSVFVQISIHLVRYRIHDKPVIVNGHSLGGACGNVYCAMRSYANDPVSSLITFGCPRSMSKEAAELFGAEWGSNIHAAVNNNDVVTRIPTRFMGFGHVPGITLNYLDEDGNLHHDISQWTRFLDRVKGRVYDFGEFGTDGIKDHKSSEYRSILKSVFDK